MQSQKPFCQGTPVGSVQKPWPESRGPKLSCFTASAPQAGVKERKAERLCMSAELSHMQRESTARQEEVNETYFFQLVPCLLDPFRSF